MDSSNAAARAIATLGIWAAVTILGIGTLVNSVYLNGGAIVLIMAILFGAALTATQLVWKSTSTGIQEQAEKTKRRTKLDRVLDKLSDQEIEDLRARLMDDSDGEQVALEELMDAHQRRTR
jgi:uncharacterized membrane protein YhiD involved in acid resistance